MIAMKGKQSQKRRLLCSLVAKTVFDDVQKSIIRALRGHIVDNSIHLGLCA